MTFSLHKNFVLFYCFLSVSLTGNAFENDSLYIDSLLSRSIQAPELKDSILDVIESNDKFINNDFDYLDDYYYLAARYFYISRDIERSEAFMLKGINLCKTKMRVRHLSKFYNLKASILSLQGDYTASIEYFKKSSEIMDYFGDKYAAALVKNNIANIFISLRDYVSASQYALDSYTYLKSVEDSVYLPSIAGILAIAEVKTDSLEKAEMHAEECLHLSESTSNIIGLIVGNYAQGDIYVKRQKIQASITSYESSMSLASTYFQKHYVLLNMVALTKATYLLGDYKASVKYGTEALAESELQNNKNVQYSIRKYLSYALAEDGDFQLAFEYLKEAHNSYLEQSGEENQEIINEILIKYETEKKEKEIAKNALTIAENETQLQKQSLFISLLIGCSILLIVIYVYYRRHQKLKFLRSTFEFEKKMMTAIQDGEELERNRISTELHDGLASEVAGLKMKVELMKTEDQPDLNNIEHLLQNIHEEIRKVSHNLMPVDFNSTTLAQALKNYCEENSIPNSKLYFNGQLDVNLDNRRSTIIYRVCQELIANARVHGAAQNCYLQLLSQKDELVLTVEDDGVGFNSKEIKKGQGLKSIEDRLALIQGEIKIESEKGTGCLIQIKVKIS